MSEAKDADVDRLRAIAAKIIADYKEHYDFPWQGESHMEDCIMAALQSLSQEAVRDEVPEQCARAVIEGINKGLEGEELLAYSRRPISAAIEQARAITEQQFSFLDKYESGGGEEQTPETNKIVDGLGESEDAVELLIRHAKSLETRWRSAIRALKREPNAAAQAGQGFSSAPSHEGHAAGPAPAAPDVASMVKQAEQNAQYWLKAGYEEPHRDLAVLNVEQAMNAYKNAMYALLARLGQGWIPVSERLPEDGAKVLIFHDDSQHVMNFHANEKEFWEEDGTWFIHLSGITHWMPLPPAP